MPNFPEINLKIIWKRYSEPLEIITVSYTHLDVYKRQVQR